MANSGHSDKHFGDYSFVGTYRLGQGWATCGPHAARSNVL